MKFSELLPDFAQLFSQSSSDNSSLLSELTLGSVKNEDACDISSVLSGLSEENE